MDVIIKLLKIIILTAISIWLLVYVGLVLYAVISVLF